MRASALPSAASDSAPRLGAYAVGRLAEAEGKPLLSAGAFRLALDGDPSSATIARRSYRQALIAGDMPLALRSLRVLEKQDAMPRDGLVLLLIDAFARRDYAGARTIADKMGEAEQLAFIAPFARSWASVGDGPYDPPVIATGDSFAAYALRHVDEQMKLQRQALDDNKAAKNAKGRTTPLTGIAVLIDRLAQDLSVGGSAAPVLSLLRMASFADPASIPIRMNVARGLIAAGYAEMAFEEAGKIPFASPVWTDAQVLRVAALAVQGRVNDAVTYARGLSQRPGAGAREFRLLGEALLQSGQYAEAADAFARALGSGAADDPKLLLQQGGALEQAGRWTEAKVLMESALAKAPDNPSILNHLGYSLADRGEELPRAIAMLEKANALSPDEPAYMDSLGWAYVRAWQFDRALPLLEKAATAAPGEAEINEHLGDALWASGRRFEARYAWNAALVTAQGEVKDRLAAKIDTGLAETAAR